MKKLKKSLILNPNELAIRKIYWPLVETGVINTFFRPGTRLCSQHRGYCEGQNIVLRCLETLGSDDLGITPKFSATKKAFASVKRIYSKRIKDLQVEDFINAGPDLQSSQQLKFHLGLIYNLSLEELNDDKFVTVIQTSLKTEKNLAGQTAHLETEIEPRIENLIQSGAWLIANKVPANPQNFIAENLMITLINQDYPARTPSLWNQAFAHFKLPAQSMVLTPNPNLTIDNKELKKALHILRNDPRFIAGGLGVGFKDMVVNLLDQLDNSALQVGASNFIAKQDGNLIAYNTDGEGFVLGLQENYPQTRDLSQHQIILLGAGGTANAIAFALAKAGLKTLYIINRTYNKALSLAQTINKAYPHPEPIAQAVQENDDATWQNILPKASVIINTSTKGASGPLATYSALSITTIGLDHNTRDSLDKLKQLPQSAIIVDIVLAEHDTPLIQQAKNLGLATLDGLPMVISQAALAFHLIYPQIEFSAIYQVMKTAI